VADSKIRIAMNIRFRICESGTFTSF